MPTEQLIGLDLGGTNIKARLVDAQGRVVAAQDMPTYVEQGTEQVISRMADAVRAVCDLGRVRVAEVAGVGVAAPGPLDMKRGVIEKSVNLPGWIDVPIVKQLTRTLRRPVTLLNDASAACFGEYWVGAGMCVDELAMFTLGTGVGGGLVSGGRLVFGGFAQAGELGHIIVTRDGRLCGCGQHGCVEAYASESHMVRRGRELGVFGDDDAENVPTLLAAAKSGSEPAQRIWADCCHAIATACVTLQHVLNPRLILLGGGVAAAGDDILLPVRTAYASLAWQMTSDAPNIELAALGSSAGAIGAAGWFLHRRGAV